MRPRFFAGFHRCLPALATAGNDLIVGHVIEFAAWRQDLARLLAGLDVFLVGVHCDLDDLDRRERDRGDRRIGEGRTHVTTDRIHDFGPYDLDVDTTAGVTPALAGSLVQAWRQRTPPGALQVTASTGRTPRDEEDCRHERSHACRGTGRRADAIRELSQLTRIGQDELRPSRSSRKDSPARIVT